MAIAAFVKYCLFLLFFDDDDFFDFAISRSIAWGFFFIDWDDLGRFEDDEGGDDDLPFLLLRLLPIAFYCCNFFTNIQKFVCLLDGNFLELLIIPTSFLFSLCAKNHRGYNVTCENDSETLQEGAQTVLSNLNFFSNSTLTKN